MKLSIFIAAAVLGSAFGFGQTNPAPSQAQPSASATSTTAKARGPESIAETDPNRVVATIDGKPLTAKQAYDMIKPYPPEQRRQIDANLANALQRIYMQRVFAESATKDNLDQQSPYKEQLEAARSNILAQAYLKKLADANGPAEDPKTYYDSHPTEFDKVKLSGIFVGFAAPGTPASSNNSVTRTEDQARDKATDLEKKLAAGGDFAALARTDSDNKATSQQGGTLGEYTIGNPQLPAEIKTAIEKLKANQFSEPIRLSNMYLIVKVDARSKVSFDEARAGIVQKLQGEKSQAALNQALQKYKIQVQDPDFFATNAPATNVPSLQRPPGSSSPAGTTTVKPPAAR